MVNSKLKDFQFTRNVCEYYMANSKERMEPNYRALQETYEVLEEIGSVDFEYLAEV